MRSAQDITLKSVSLPEFGLPGSLPELSDAVYRGRFEKTLDMMRKEKLDYLLVYGDREHYANFEYLSGFDLRFEEGLLVLSVAGEACYILGNECLPLAATTRIPARAELYQGFSLPSQPIDMLHPLSDILGNCGLKKGCRTGVIGWKLMAPRYAGRDVFDVPSFIVRAAEKTVGAENLLNVTDFFIHPAYGLRVLNTADDIAYFEYGAAWASIGLIDMLDGLKTGLSELEASRMMRIGAMTENSHPLTVAGEGNDAGMVYPSNRKLELGGRFNCSLGLRGGLSCRTGYLAYSEADLPEGRRDYLDVLAKPYYAAVVTWYESMRIGTNCGDVYDRIEAVLPKAQYHWTLNTGHYIANEEWLSSPFETGSPVEIRSGMCLQMDFIPGIDGYAGANCEDGVAIADETLRAEIKARFPEVWARMVKRRRFMTDVLNIRLPDEVLPMSNLAAIYRPYMLNKDMALAVR